MDEQQQASMPPNQSEEPAKNSHRTIYATIAVVFVIILVLVAGAAYAYFSGYRPFQTASTPTNVATSTDTVVWESIPSETPFKHINISLSAQESKDGNTSTYDLYKAGTFTSGPLSGSELVFGLGTYTYGDNGVGDYGSEYVPYYYNGYVYLVVNASGTPIGWWQDRTVDYPSELGLANVPKLDDSLFPAKLLSYVSNDRTLVRPTPDGPITLQTKIVLPTSDMHLQSVPGFMFDSNPILRDPTKSQLGIFSGIQPYNYYVQLPTGILFPAALAPNFMSAEGLVPEITWSTGSTTVAAYNYDQYAYGLSDCYDSLKSFSTLESTFVQTGTTSKGDPVYEVSPIGRDSVYQCLYAKTQRYNYDSVNRESIPYYPTTYSDFLNTHPVFFWKNATNDWVIFGRTDVIPAAEKAKPVIYLYPTKTEQVSVQVNPIGGFTKTDPTYGNGWNVNATPDSALTNLTDGNTYPYLFWEGGASGVVNTPKEGFVVARDDVSTLLADKLSLLGLNEKERTDFMDFWIPRLSKAPYYFITFVPKSEMDRVAPLAVIPTPDSVIRILMDYKPLSAPISVSPLKITTPVRTGFTVVEWGGIVRD